MLTTTPTTRLDPGLTTAHLAWLRARFGNRTTFFIETVTLPDHLSSLENALYGPVVGDPPVAEADVFYAPQGPRTWRSRLIHKPARPTRLLTVIAGPDNAGRMTLSTAFGGPLGHRKSATRRPSISRNRTASGASTRLRPRRARPG